jgi:predicted PurR-regulated permease PerM
LLKLEVSYRGLLFAALTVAGIWFAIQLWSVLILLVVALIFTVGLLPFVEGLVQKGVPRAVAAVSIILTVIALIVALFSFLVPALISEVQDVRANLPDSAHEIEKLLASFGIDVELQDRARNIDWNKLISGRAAVDYTQRAVNLAVGFTTILAMTAYLLVDMPKLVRFVRQFIPEEHLEDADRIARGMIRVVGGYLRGQFITSLIIGVYTFIVLTVVGVPNPLAFAVFASFADIIPLVGAFIAVLPPVAAALEISYSTAIVVLALLELYQMFEDRLLVPRIYGSVLNLPPLIVLLAVLAGGELFGVTGVLLALPLTAAGRVFLDYALEQRGMSFTLPPLPEADSADDAETMPGEPQTEIFLGSSDEPALEPPRAGRRLLLRVTGWARSLNRMP